MPGTHIIDSQRQLVINRKTNNKTPLKKGKDGNFIIEDQTLTDE